MNTDNRKFVLLLLMGAVLGVLLASVSKASVLSSIAYIIAWIALRRTCRLK